jgi:hypothetical protein
MILPMDFGDLEDVVSKVSEHAQAAVFDHRLSHGTYTPFTGAEAVAALYEHNLPGMLVTTYMMDIDVSIRRVRDRIPVVIERRSVNGDVVRAGIGRVAAELVDGPDRTRLPRRVMVRIEAVSREDDQDVADAVVPSWNPQDAVRFPLALLPPKLAADPNALRGQRLIAMVNIGAPTSSELYLHSFEQALEPDAELA